MAGLAALLEQLAQAGASVHVRQGRLGVTPQEALARFAPLLKQHKPALLELASAAGGVLPPERLAELAQELAGPQAALWQALLSLTSTYAERLEALRPPLLVVLVDGVTALVAVWVSKQALEHHSRFPGMPLLTTEQWLTDALTKLARYYPTPASSIELYAQWPGNPPRRVQVGRARRLEVRHEPPSLADAGIGA